MNDIINEMEHCHCKDICKILNDKFDSTTEKLKIKYGQDFVCVRCERYTIDDIKIVLKEKNICDCFFQ